MTVSVSNTSLADSFNTWRLNTNYIATVMGNNVVTVNPHGVANRGGNATGNGMVEGTFAATVLRTPTLQGGNTSYRGNLFIATNTTIGVTGTTNRARTFNVYANTTFHGNVIFNTVGSDRVNLGDIDRVILGGGTAGQFIRTSGTTDNPQYKSLTLRDITDMSLDSAHIILSGANSSFSNNGDTTHLIFESDTDYIHMYLAKDEIAGDSDLFVNLADADGDSRFVIADSANTVVAHIDSDGNVDITGTLNVDGSTTLNGVSATTIQANNTLNVLGLASLDGGIDVDGAFTVANDTGNIDTAGTLNVDGATSLNETTVTTLTANSAVDFKSTLNVDGDTTLNGTTVTTLAANGTSSLHDTTVTTLTANSAVDFKSTLNVDGDTTLNGTTVTTLTANGTSSLNDTTVTTLAANGTSSLHDTTVTTLAANGTSSLNDTTVTTLAANGTSSLHDTTVTTLAANGTSSLNDTTVTTLSANGTSSLHDTTVTTLTANLAVDFKSTLNVDGDTSLNGTTVTTLAANGTSSLNDTTVTTLAANGTSSLHDTTVTTLAANGTSSLNDTTVTTLTANLAVDFKSTLNVDESTSLNELTTTTITANGNVDLKSNVDIGDANTNTLTINSEIVSHLVPSTNDSVMLGKHQKQWSNLFVIDANVASTLHVDGSTSLNGDVDIGEDRTVVTVPEGSTVDEVKRSLYDSGDLSKLNVYANTVFHDKVTLPSDTKLTIAEGTFTNLTVTSSLIVSGTTTTINTETINLADNIINLNSNLASDADPTQNAGISINRGSSVDVELIWNEDTDRWQVYNTNGTQSEFNDILSANAHSITDRDAVTSFSGENDFLLVYDASAGKLVKGTIQNVALQGVQGTVGAQGANGTSIQGAVGAQGANGTSIQGTVGAQGANGTSIQGTVGAQGANGTSIQGTSGAQGANGTSIQGTSGAQGANGTSIQGTSGAQGANGTSIQGTVGAQGANGTSIQGAVGAQGANGTSIQGTQGTQGIQGIQGTQGVQGASVQGTSGATFLSATNTATKTAGSLTFNDNIEKYYGTGNDYSLYFNGSNMYVDSVLTTTDLYFRSNSTTRFTFDMGTGDFIATGDVISLSDARVKENIIDVDNALEKVINMRGVYFNKVNSENDRRHVGVVAQEIEKILPEVVTEDAEGMKNVAYGNLVGVLIEAIKELKAEIEYLKNKE